MNLDFYNIISSALNDAIAKAYKAGIVSVVKKNKATILKLDEPRKLFEIDYTGTDRIALQNFKVEAFTVAGVMSYELEEKLKELALELQEGKHPLAKGESDINKVWIDEAYNIISDYVPIPDMPAPGFLETNLRTAIQSSYHAAQYIRLQDDSVRGLYPAYQYKTLADNRVREEHRKLHDRIWSSNDPIWDKIWPPLSWNCRCYVNPLGEDELHNEAAEPLTNEDSRKEIIKEANINKDFDRNPGQAKSIWGKWLDTKFKDLDYNKKFKEVFQYSRSLAKYESKNLLDSILQKNVGEYKSKELNQESWSEEFPENKVDTPIGPATFIKPRGYNSQVEKLLEKDDNRKKYFGLIKDTFNNPTMIIKDEKGGLLFVRTFRKDDKDIMIIGVGEKDGEIIELKSASRRQIRNLFSKIKNGEVLHFSRTALATFTAIPRKHLPFGSDLLNRNIKLNFSDDLKNIKINDGLKGNVRVVMTQANEIWGETYNYKGVVNSELHYIRYRVDGFEIVKVNNNEAYEFKFIGYESLDEYRKGVILD